MTLDAAAFRRHRAVPHPAWHWLGGSAFDLHARLAQTDLIVEGFERLSSEPVLLTSNASHMFDFFPLRCLLRRAGIPAVSIAKGKYFQHPAMSWAFGRVGVVPIISRGYLIVADFLAVHGRRPEEPEYRALRRHLDAHASLPAHPTFDALRDRPRTLLGFPFAPRAESYRTAMLRTYECCMMETVRLARTAVKNGHHVHLYPEGTVSSRLGTGRRGAVQLAHALGLAIQPVGISGCREAFRSTRTPRLRGGRITIRFGERWSQATAALPASFKPFHPLHERDCAPLLDDATEELMRRLDALLEPPYRHSPTHLHDGSAGVGRFL
jgi:1-acyl-sn-glycerol-3-phosphate acyltransferase